MKVFISWSGDRSRMVADLLDEWIQCVIQAVDPWMSSKDIDRGSLWFSEITDQLQDTNIGIVCLTKENLNKPWILFESGALAKGLSSSRVCTFLIDLDPSDVGNPLAQFNHTQPDKEGLWSLVSTLNNTLGDNSLKEKVLEQVFDTYWPQFESKFARIIEDTPEIDNVPKRSETDMLGEVLSTMRRMEKQIRDLEGDQTRKRRVVTSDDNIREALDRKASDLVSLNPILQGFNHADIQNLAAQIRRRKQKQSESGKENDDNYALGA